MTARSVSESSKNFSIVLVGAGNMGGAMLSGWLDGGISAGRITVVDPSPPDPMRKLIEQHGVAHITEPETELEPDVLIVAVKPQIMEKVLPGAMKMIGANTVVVSVAAGKTVDGIETGLGIENGTASIIRCMPNTPAQVQRGITVCFANSATGAVQRANTESLLSAIGEVAWIDDEAQMDAVTAVSGSGPAYVFLLAELMAVAGVKAGLPEALAEQLARATVSGGGELIRQSQLSAATLRENVTSPGGTTAAALEVLRATDAMPKLLQEAIEAAAKRSRELK